MTVGLEDAVVLTETYIDLVSAIAQAAGAELRRLFESMGSIDRADIASFVEQARPITSAGAAEAAELTTGYLSELTGETPSALDLVETAKFDAPFLRTWHNLKEGQAYEDARAGGAYQAETVGHDATLDGGAQRMTSPGVKVRGWRRVITPTACEWCQVVSTQLYKTAETARLQGKHHDCKCHVVAVPSDKADVAQAMNRARLKQLKASGAVSRVSAARERNRDRTRAARVWD